jgi:hypothetical protein
MQLPTGPYTAAIYAVTVSTPQEEGSKTRRKGPRINMFYERTTENPALKNQMIPGRGGHPSEERPSAAEPGAALHGSAL